MSHKLPSLKPRNRKDEEFRYTPKPFTDPNGAWARPINFSTTIGELAPDRTNKRRVEKKRMSRKGKLTTLAACGLALTAAGLIHHWNGQDKIENSQQVLAARYVLNNGGVTLVEGKSLHDADFGKEALCSNLKFHIQKGDQSFVACDVLVPVEGKDGSSSPQFVKVPVQSAFFADGSFTTDRDHQGRRTLLHVSAADGEEIRKNSYGLAHGITQPPLTDQDVWKNSYGAPKKTGFVARLIDAVTPKSG